MDIDFLSRRRRCSTLASCIDPEKNWKLRRQTASLLLPEDLSLSETRSADK
jgi:hypothetical protein